MNSDTSIDISNDERIAIDSFITRINNVQTCTTDTLDDAKCLKFLRARKLDVDRAVGLYLNYLRMQQRIGNLEDRLDNVYEFAQQGAIVLPNLRLSDNSELLLFLARMYKPSECKTIDVAHLLLFVLDHALNRVATQKNGLTA